MISKAFLKQLEEKISADDHALIIEFFVTFSRFEYALKAAGFVNIIRNKIQPNWDAFTKSIRSNFDNSEKSVEIQNAINFLTTQPPQIQIYFEEQLRWNARYFSQTDPIINRLNISIHDIRNNLFHGGKFSDTFQIDITRNSMLIKHAIEILNYWLSLNDRVRYFYLEPI